jgi:glutamate synthase (ferredoxin)
MDRLLFLFTDGNVIGTLLDRNGLRPSRYTLTKKWILYHVLRNRCFDVDPEDVIQHGRLSRKMFLVEHE